VYVRGTLGVNAFCTLRATKRLWTSAQWDIAHSLLCEPADLIMRNPLDKSAPWSIMDQMKKADPETRARIAAVVEALSKTGT
jgi:hypothetical protein